MMKRKIGVLIFALFPLAMWAQQIQQFTQYPFLGLMFNPAFAGSEDNFNAFGVHRTQWTGINDAPRTYAMGLHAPSASRKMGFGGTLFTDVTGPTRRTGVNGSYAYHLQVNSASKISLGITFGLTQFSIDGSQISLRQEGDQALLPTMQAQLLPDAAFGALWYGENFYVGLSANQILNNRVELFQSDGQGRMAVHYFFTGAYKFALGESIEIEPATLVKYVNPISPQVDITARVIYNKALWLGGTYRTNDAAAVMAGYEFLNYLTIGYSFDFTTTDIRNYSDGTHEIMLRVRFKRKQLVEDPEAIPDN